MRLQYRQILVTGYNNLHITRKSCRKDNVIIRVAAYRPRKMNWLNHNRPRLNQSRCRFGFRRAVSKFPHQNITELIQHGFGQDNIMMYRAMLNQLAATSVRYKCGN